MSITSYLNNGNYMYKFQQWKSFAEQNASGASDSSGTSGLYNASGASGMNVTVETTVENLNINQIVDLFTKGNLTTEELVKWLNENADQPVSEPVETGDMIKYEFTYKGKTYSISCTKEASESQLDNNVQKVFYKSHLKSKGFSDEQINKYFVEVYALNGRINQYVLNPDLGFKDINELKQMLNGIKGDFAFGFDKEVSAEEAESVIKNVTDLFKIDLKEKYNFSDDFLDKIVEFAKKEIIRECIKDNFNYDNWYANVKLYEAGDNYWNEYYNDSSNLKDILNSIKSDIEIITGDAVYWKKRVAEIDENGNIISWKEYEYSQSEEYLSSAWQTDSFINSNAYCFGDQPYGDSFDDPYCKQNCFLSNLFTEALYKLGIDRFYNSDYDECQEFKSRVLNLIAERIGVDVNEMTPMDIMTKLDKNGNNSWLDELSDCINEVYEATYIPNYQNAEYINADVLFGDNESIDAKYIQTHLVDFKFSNDAGTKRFNDVINGALYQFNIYNDYDELELISTLIKFINKEAGITQNSNPPKLSKETINKLGNNIFTILDKILEDKDDSFKKEYYFGSIDGEIGNYGQGGTGDCWLLAGINAMRNTKEGRKNISESIKYDETRDVYVVTLQGIKNPDGTPRSYDITKTEIETAIKDSNYSYGDRDAYLIERAMEKLMYDIWEGKVEVPEEIIYKRDPNKYDSDLGGTYGSVDGGMLYGGNASHLIYAMTGNTSKLCSIISDENLYGVLDGLYKQFQSEDIGIEVAFNYTPKEGDRTGWHGKLIETENGDVEFCNQHAYTIIGMTITEPSDPNNNTITIVNPWYPDRECTITWAEFAEIGVSTVEILNISGAELPNINLNEYIDKLLKQFEDGEITGGELYNYFIRIRETLSDDVKDYIVNKSMLYAASGVIEDSIINKMLLWLGNVHSYSNPYWQTNSQYTSFEYNGSLYGLDYNNPNKLAAYFSEDIFNYTTDNNLINQYFDIVGTKDNEPFIYRLKDGVTFEDFVNQKDIVVNNLFAPFENGEIDEDTLISNIDIKTHFLNDKQKKSVSDKLIELCISGKLYVGNIEFILRDEFGLINDVHAEFTNGMIYHKFVYDSKEYIIFSHSSKINSSNERHTSDEILNYTQDSSLIYEFFELGASIDGQPVMYILKDGVTFEEFLQAAQQ